MKLMNSKIKPFDGLEEIKLYNSLDDVKNYLNRNSIKYTSEIWNSEEETVPNPWTVLFVEDCINLYFAGNNKLFKIYCTKGFEGTLPNGIGLNTTLEEAKRIDNTLEYNDDGEDYESKDGYWVEDDLDTGKLFSITVYIKEILDDNIFDSLKW